MCERGLENITLDADSMVKSVCNKQDWASNKEANNNDLDRTQWFSYARFGTLKGKTVNLRLRSVSNTDETVMLSWPTDNSEPLNLCEIEEVPNRKVSYEIIVPANGFVTLKAAW
jgi:hypothetical protein